MNFDKPDRGLNNRSSMEVGKQGSEMTKGVPNTHRKQSVLDGQNRGGMNQYGLGKY